MTRAFTSYHGGLVAIALEGCWRQYPGPLKLTKDELQEIAPILLRSGAAGLVWWRLSRTAPSESDPELFEAYKQQTLQAAVHEDDIAHVFRVLDSAQLEALAVKGWAIARLYPDPGLRHYGDLDLCVRVRDYARAEELLEEDATKGIWIDLHQGATALDCETEEELFARSILVPAGETSVRIPSPEDHLRILCLHLLRHGAWRPLWLCDVALALESREANFDWDLFFGNDRKRADWLACVLGLAHRLLGARLEGTPVALRASTLPSWLPRAVLRRWGRWFNADYRDTARYSFWAHRWQPMRLLEDLYFRCDPIRATVELGGSFTNRPRLPYQLAALLRRAPQVAARMLNGVGNKR
jgi:Uncharacterised nucleotidyltransferase